MTSFKGLIKYLIFKNLPVRAKFFPYFRTKVYFPKGSLLFRLACEQDVYERDNILLLRRLVQPNSVYFDVGANIGLMAIPILQDCETCQVVSFEPSPATLQFLRRTSESSCFNNRWTIVGKALSDQKGSLDFFIAEDNLSAYDGFQNTQRVGQMSTITVPVTTLDNEWKQMNKPRVSAIKIDVEGAELNVISGAISCIETERPSILLEWTSLNLKAYGHLSNKIFDISRQIEYQIYSVPMFTPINDKLTLEVSMLRTESFLLVHKEKCFSEIDSN